MPSAHEAAVCTLKNALCAVWLCKSLSGGRGGGHACGAKSGALKQQWVRSKPHCGLCGCANLCFLSAWGATPAVHEAAVRALKTTQWAVWFFKLLSGGRGGGHACGATSGALRPQWVRSKLHCGLCGCANLCFFETLEAPCRVFMKRRCVRSKPHCALCGCATSYLVVTVGDTLVAQNLAL